MVVYKSALSGRLQEGNTPLNNSRTSLSMHAQHTYTHVNSHRSQSLIVIHVETYWVCLTLCLICFDVETRRWNAFDDEDSTSSPSLSEESSKELDCMADLVLRCGELTGVAVSDKERLVSAAAIFLHTYSVN